MDENKKDCSKFQTVILEIIREKLNLMLSEISQLKQNGESIDFDNNLVLIKTILKKIATKEITSVHISSDEATSYINTFDELDSHLEKHHSKDNEEEKLNDSIFLESPFT